MTSSQPEIVLGNEPSDRVVIIDDRSILSASPLTVVDIADFLACEFPPRANLLAPWLPRQGLAMIHARRGVGKTHIALGIASAVASGSTFLRWTAPTPRGVLFIDGEMPAVALQDRLAAIVAASEAEPVAPLRIITPDLQKNGMPDLSRVDDHGRIEDYLDDIDLIIVDNISTLCRTGRENEAESWLPVQEWALRMRGSGRSVLFIHHGGKGGQQRGTSRREDILDTVISLRHPSDYRPEEGAVFEVHFEKARGIYGDD
ncbi:MAG: AAA family ATPase, partial [Gammaproteobacteria bacterium]|nr:AAA family ATPase [Gammaproteobacteria bacterium]